MSSAVRRPGWERPGCARSSAGAPEPEPEPRSPATPPQASAYLKQNKYQQAEELYKEILSTEDLPAPLGEPRPRPPPRASQCPPHNAPVCSPGAPSTGRAGDAEQQVRMGFARLPGWRRLGVGGVGLDGVWGLTVSGASQTLRRSSSFSKLRESIRRGSEKLVSRLRGEGAAGAAG